MPSILKHGVKVAIWEHLSRLILIAVCALVGGSVGLIMASFMFYVSYKNVIVDRVDKHGISQKTASRFGGPTVGLGAVAFGFAFLAMEESGVFGMQTDVSLGSYGYVIVAVLAGGVGFLEDYAERLSPWFRLGLLFLIVGTYLSCIAVELPSDVFPIEFPLFLNHPLVVGIGMTVCVVGFINAGNVADGANGLLSTIAIAVLLIGYLQTEDLTLFAVLVSTFVFSLYNLVTGSLFLGDSGAYFLSALMALVCMNLYMQGESSVWFYACLVSYPCVELVRLIYFRVALGNSILIADNNHLHNMVFEKLRKIGLSPLLGNTCTGLSLAVFSLIFPVSMYMTKAMPLDSYWWPLAFCGYGILHLRFAKYLSAELRVRS